MDIIESIKKNKSYVKYKILVKNWEKDFKVKNTRTPSKFDIKEAPSNIKYAYKKYFQMKSDALENSLSVCDTEDDLISPEPLRNFQDITFDLSPTMESLPMLPSAEQLDQLLNKAPNNNSNLVVKPTPNENLKQSTNKINDNKPSPFTDNLSKKLFQSKSFCIRNPRKSFLNKSQTLDSTVLPTNEVYSQNQSLTNSQQGNISIPQNEINVKNNVSSSNNSGSSFSSVTFKMLKSFESTKNLPVRQINNAWLDRVTDSESMEDSNLNIPNASVNTSNHFGITNININNFTAKTCDYIDNSESDDDVAIANLKPALKKRKLVHNDELNNKSINNDIKENDSTIIQKKVSAPNKRKSKPTKIQEQRRKKSDKNNEVETIPPNISDYLPFGLEENVEPLHKNVTDVLKVIKDSNKLDSESGLNLNNRLEEKIKNGTLNENFVKINIEKKVFVRGKKQVNFSKYKKKLWKDKKALNAGMEFPESGKVTCFKCGGTGHMARYCTAHRGDHLLPMESCNEDDLPTLDDMKNCVSQETNQAPLEELSSKVFECAQVPDYVLKMLSNKESEMDIKPVYSKHDQEAPKELYDALKLFGHSEFRSGQEHAIMRVLCGLSTLLILSTGGGKSLCYQLPAYIYSKYYKCITLVISPLVSLMEDQVLSMPEFLKAGCLHTNQTTVQRKKIIECLKNGELNILLISPEALISGDSSNGFGGLFKSLPKIAFACIDEAHCVSQWSHNFRPSYLLICRTLKEKLNVKCILGLTATASKTTIHSVINYLNVPDGLSGVITNPTLPDNLHLSVSFERDKDKALIRYLATDQISCFNSIIIYCIRRDECERVAAVVRSCLQESGKINMEKSMKRKKMSFIAEAYHAGMSAAQRKKIQKNFMDGTIRIIVATVAFGMGINKANIRCIIHYNVPSSFESYVQEVGRAGRDGNPAYCHVFMDNSKTDKSELLKHIHANSLDRPTIRKLLQKVFNPCSCSKNSNSTVPICKGHEVAIPIDSSVEELDMPSENIATLFCYLELYSDRIRIHNTAYIMCKIMSYGGSQKILEAAKTCPPLAMAYLIESKKDPQIMRNNILEFNVIEVSAAIGWASGMTKYHLKNLEWINEMGSSRRSTLKVEFNTLGYRIKAPGDLNATELDDMLDKLHEIVLNQEKSKLYQLEESYQSFKEIGDFSLEKNKPSDSCLLQKSNDLKLKIRNYFERDNNIPEHIALEQRPLNEESIASDVRALVSSYKDCKFTGRSIARIFQGIPSPNFPPIVWGRCKYWRSHIHEDFNGIIKIATQQLLFMK